MLAAIAPSAAGSARATADPRRVIADGCADALVLCDGGRHRGGASCRSEFHLGAAQLSGGSQSLRLRARYLQLRFGRGPLLICGVLKIIYDLLLLIQFRHVKPPEEL